METPRRPRVLLLIPHLGGGGAERVTALLARGLSRQKYELHLATIAQSHPVPESLPSHVTLHPLGARRVRGGALPLVRLVRRTRPDLILSGMAHLNFLVLLLRPFFPHATRVMVRQNSTASAALRFGGLPWYTRALYRLLYPRADRVICQTAAMVDDLCATIGVARGKLIALPNPVEIEEIRARVAAEQANLPAATDRDAGPRLLALGRLSKEKGFDLLLEALAPVRRCFPSATVLMAGDGGEGPALKAHSLALGLQGAVRFAGHVAEIAKCFAGASVFVLCSRYEGLPNALLEAAAAGLPIVALPSSRGVVDLLSGRPGVWLASEITAPALADHLLAALRALGPGERFAHSFIDSFRLERVVEAYENLIDSVLSEAAR